MIPTQTLPDSPTTPLIPPMDPEERRRRNAAVVALIEEWANDEASDQDQRETMDVLRKALGPDRVASNRPAFS
jgi:hypothetical protein